jgi:nitroimidazol reductase NimA-like FMN-containing flavoprotein (pyridoxamine 5'-phosphate oxidase superfamily)
MQGRRVRRKDKEIGKNEVEAALRANQVGHLATFGTDGYPYVVPMNYFYTGDKIILHSAPEGEKIENIKTNPRVCFTVMECQGIVAGQNLCDYTTAYRSVIVFGRARFIEGVEKERLLGEFVGHLLGSESPRLPREEIAKVAVIAIEIQAVTGKKSGGFD